MGIFPEASQPCSGYMGCGQCWSSVQSYLPWETASQGLVLCNPIPPISHRIFCHMEWLRVPEAFAPLLCPQPYFPGQVILRNSRLGEPGLLMEARTPSE